MVYSEDAGVRDILQNRNAASRVSFVLGIEGATHGPDTNWGPHLESQTICKK